MDPTSRESLREQLDKAKKAQEDAYEALADKMLELEVQYTTELGPRGQEFEIIDLRKVAGTFVVVKPVTTDAHKRFVDGKKKEQDFVAYVLPALLHPSRDEFLQLVDRKSGVLGFVAMKLAKLHGELQEVEEGK